jgi:hypothetical protein
MALRTLMGVETGGQEEDEGMARADGQSVLLRQFYHRLVGAAAADQGRAGGLAEGQAEADAGNGVHQRFVHVLHGLDKVAHPQDEVDIIRFLDADGQEFHRFTSRYET